MDDGFTYGAPAKRRGKLGGPRPPRTPRTGGSLVALGLVTAGLAVAAVLLFVFLRGADRAGTDVADARTGTTSTLDRANDAAAQATIGGAVVAARTAWAEAGAYPTDPQALAGIEPSITFTTGESTGPDVVAVGGDGTSFAAAVRSTSGTCWWVLLDAAGVTTYGSGAACTGEAARSADAPSW